MAMLVHWVQCIRNHRTTNASNVHMTQAGEQPESPELQKEAVDVLVIGAGASGLTALRELDRAGLRVLCVEARDRIGGRIYSIHDPLSPLPIELGAEFVHGRPPEIWNLLADASDPICELSSEFIHMHAGKRQEDSKIDAGVGRLMDEVKNHKDDTPDESFAAFLRRSRYPPDVKHWAESFVEGFNAAKSDLISVASLAGDQRASEKIDGDRSFRVLSGYDAVIQQLVAGITGVKHKLRTNSVVEAIRWQRGSAITHVRSAITGQLELYRSRRVLITVPLGVLQAKANEQGAIDFQPEPQPALQSARKLAFGQVFRIVLRFDEPFWEKNPDLAEAGFILSDERFFPTWWTPLPVRAPIITGWSASQHAEGLIGEPRSRIVTEALASLSRITGLQPSRLEQAYFHDWHADPFSRGAYSYVPAGALPDRRKLAEPVEETLYFGGEATDVTGHSATVHGAIASGKRAARQILESTRSGT